MIVLETSFLVEALSGAKRNASALGAEIGRYFQRLSWTSGRTGRATQELATQEALFPAEQAVAFGPADARVGAALYRQVGRARSREIDLATAICAILQEAELWTMNTK